MSDAPNYYQRNPAPIREGYWKIRDYLRWCLSSQGRRSRRSLQGLKDHHAGESCIVCCNGPSLNDVDFSSLGTIPCFGLNKIHLKFPSTNWRPRYIVAVNAMVIEQTASVYDEMSIPLFASRLAAHHLRRTEAVHLLNPLPDMLFSTDPSIGICEGFTVTYVALQLAYYLGFKEVALVGCDHSFASKGLANSVTTTRGNDANHFDPNYFANGVSWQLPDLEGSEYAYRLARDAYQRAGRTIYNCSAGGFLETFPRMSLADFVARHRHALTPSPEVAA